MNIRNPLYCGKIVIPKYKDEEAHTVKAQHEPLISELLFYQVQDVLDGRKRHYRPKKLRSGYLLGCRQIVQYMMKPNNEVV